METAIIQINNNQAFNFFRDLEALNVIKVLNIIPFAQTATNQVETQTFGIKNDNIERLSKIRAITKNINVDLTNFRFNREEANNYYE